MNAEDFTPFSNNLNQTAAYAAAAGGLISANGLQAEVPEPAALSMMAFAIASASTRKRRI